MLFLAGVVLMTGALFVVHLASRAARRPSTPNRLRAAALGNPVALLATALLASGLAVLLQAAIAHGSVHGGATGIALAGAGAVLPFVGLFWLAKRPVVLPLAGEAAGLPPTTGGRPRRGRTESRPADAAGRAFAARKAV